MKHFLKTVLIVFLLFSLFNPLFVLSKTIEQQKPGVICTTSILAHLTEEITQKLVSVTTIAPAGMCPAHFDIKPSQIQAVQDGQLLISHNFEPWIENLLYSADNTGIERLVLAGPWNTPVSATDKIHEISEKLGQIFPQNKQQFTSNTQTFIKNLNQQAVKMEDKAKKLNMNRIKAIASFHQASFAQWLGLEVVATFPSPETISTKEFLELLLTGKKEKIDLVIDNLQSGTDFGGKLAADLNASHVVLTNFPGLVPQTESLAGMISYNAEQLFKTVKGDVQ